LPQYVISVAAEHAKILHLLWANGCFASWWRKTFLYSIIKQEKGRAIFIPEFITAVCISAGLSALFVFATRRGGQRTGLLWLFLIIFLATWAGGVWIKPFGPTLWGIHWLAFLVAGLFVLALLAVAIPRRAPRGRRETLDMLERVARERELEQVTYLTLGAFFWILLAALVIAILFRYLL
jgi:hypothetical protein